MTVRLMIKSSKLFINNCQSLTTHSYLTVKRKNMYLIDLFLMTRERFFISLFRIQIIIFPFRRLALTVFNEYDKNNN